MAMVETQSRRELVEAILSDIGVSETFSRLEATNMSENKEAQYARSPSCHVVAGANGSGKTTFAIRYLPGYAGCCEFINPDLIALGLSPFNPLNAALKAGKLVLERIADMAGEKKDFAFETTLSGIGYLNQFRWLKEQGYCIHLYYLWTSDPSLLVSRIQNRVKAGGHHVPDEDVFRRYKRSIGNVARYLTYVDKFRLFDNSEMQATLVYEKNSSSVIVDSGRYAKMKAGLGL